MHCISAILFPPHQETLGRKFIKLPHDWKMSLWEDVDDEDKLQNAIFISTDYFGGPGEQTAILVKNCKVVSNSEWNFNKFNPINDALKYFGLVKDENVDEFDTINLGRYRSNEEISEALKVTVEIEKTTRTPFQILVKPKQFKGKSSWQTKYNGVVLVEKETDIEPLWKLLCAQDEYWKSYKNLIKVTPLEIDSEDQISRMCEYCGKTDIYDITNLQKEIPFIIYQEIPVA